CAPYGSTAPTPVLSLAPTISISVCTTSTPENRSGAQKSGQRPGCWPPSPITAALWPPARMAGSSSSTLDSARILLLDSMGCQSTTSTTYARYPSKKQQLSSFATRSPTI
ncbi:hypothetical protein LTR95_006289, partial [Oleoguttula sp. CCFEE 5521]